MKDSKIVVFYNPKQVPDEETANKNFSKSPLKPKILMSKIKNLPIRTIKSFKPFNKEQFYLAHKKDYVDRFFSGKAIKRFGFGSGLAWSEQFAESVRYTNSSLYEAIKYAVENPTTVTFSPTSGFHHARPENGQGFCTFSGQVIASMLIYEKYQKVGAYLDLDGHFGNSIEDSRFFVEGLNKAIPRGANINPSGEGQTYLKDLKKSLEALKIAIKQGLINYVVWCHGADSHEDDDLGGQLTTEQWLSASRMFYNWVNEVEKETGNPLPIILTLFGGYRKNNYEAVIDLHISDLKICIDKLLKK